MTFEAQDFRDRLRAAVKNAGGNQIVAEKARIKLGTLNSWLSGSMPSIDKLVQISIACDVSLEWLVLGLDTAEADTSVSSNSTDRLIDSMQRSIVFVLDEFQDKKGIILSAGTSSEDVADTITSIFVKISDA